MPQAVLARKGSRYFAVTLVIGILIIVFLVTVCAPTLRFFREKVAALSIQVQPESQQDDTRRPTIPGGNR